MRWLIVSNLNVIGNGELARLFINETFSCDILFFASGVSNSNCVDRQQFCRESNLLKQAIQSNPGKKIVYFSSSALSAEKYAYNDYYKHKLSMEQMVKQESASYVIFRFPQVFGCYNANKNTLINFIFKSILNNVEINVSDDAYRYLIYTKDLQALVLEFLKHNKKNVTIDFSNPYRYHILEIIEMIENHLQRKCQMTVVKHTDKYSLDLSMQNKFINEVNLELGFSESYFKNRLQYFYVE